MDIDIAYAYTPIIYPPAIPLSLSCGGMPEKSTQDMGPIPPLYPPYTPPALYPLLYWDRGLWFRLEEMV